MKHFGFRFDLVKKRRRKGFIEKKRKQKEKEEEEGEIVCVFGGEMKMDGCDEGVGFVCSKQSCVITAVHGMTRKEQQYITTLSSIGSFWIITFFFLLLSLEY